MTLYHDPNEKGTPARVARPARIIVPGLGEILVARRMTLEEAMQSVAYVVRNCPGLGYFVEEMQGHALPRGRYWLFKVNGNLADHGISGQFIIPGDRVEWFQSDALLINTSDNGEEGQ